MEPQSLSDMNYESMPSPASFICPTDMETSLTPEDFDDSVSIKTESTSQDQSQSTAPKKKRKSWGQVLPKPTTNLPPRKRAKTEEEKAQRKYERVQRNRHAAHQSRMRKQEEMEKLQVENNQLKEDNSILQERISRLEAALATATKHSNVPHCPPTPPATFDHPTPELSSPGSLPSDDISIDTPPYSPITPDMNISNTKAGSSYTQSAALCSQQWTLDSPPFHRDKRKLMSISTLTSTSNPLR